MIDEPFFEERWKRWLLDGNRHSVRIALYITLLLFPCFGVLDYLLAPHSALPFLWGTRTLVMAAAVAMFPLVRSSFFERHPDLLAGAYTVVVGSGIGVITVPMGGLASHYYVGLSLVIIGAGLLFVWEARTVAVVQSLVVLAFVVPNLATRTIGPLPIALSNMCFLCAITVVASIGQIVLYNSQRQQLLNQVRLEQTKASLEAAHNQLKQLDSFKSELFANITHEFKTPLAMVLAPLELMLQGETGEYTPAQQNTFQSMFRAGLKLLKMIGDLLDLSKLEDSKLRLKVAENDLCDYLRGLVAQVEPLAQRKNIALQLTLDVEKSLVYCDLERVERVFLNLLSNATKFTPPGGRIAVRLRESGKTTLVTVQDDGPGFPPEKAERIFERFYQVDMGGTRKYGGTGIGLALAKEIVELHGGRIWAESGGGAKFTVELLKDREHFPAEVLDRRGAPRSLPGGNRGGDRGLMDFAVQMSARDEYRLLDIAEATERRVTVRDSDEHLRPHIALVVDDTPDIIRLVHTSLRSHFKVISADDGLKGLELAMKERPSLIVTDLMMPGIDGLELTKRLRADATTSHIPILMLTAKGDLGDRVIGLETGVSAYVAKPFSPRELLTQARALVKAQANTADLVLTQRMDSLEIVAGGLAHEINNPLNYLKNALARIRIDANNIVEGKVDDLPKTTKRMTELFDIAESGIKRITGTVELMSSYGKAGFSRQLRPHDVFEAARETVALVLPATGRAVRVELDFSGDGVIDCVPEELNQVISNLVQNAIEASSDVSGMVQVRGYIDEEDKLVLSVKDNGPGVKPEDAARIFTPFFTTKGPGRGMGMGLTIAWRVVQALGGNLQVLPGPGAEFVMRVPRKQPKLRAVS
ncbi:MAG TPA: ATP-binding protein [Myxococcales bacterium]|jgi:signal transduction histidine kinase|nr:ATP-binding protein [Myxococcales bacterium]